ncbi:MAG: hypothetical protein U9Q83_05615, partial [Bacteroidota bacterium]|nr:hypothetical protein [Bacteroidota bacterium]
FITYNPPATIAIIRIIQIMGFNIFISLFFYESKVKIKVYFTNIIGSGLKKQCYFAYFRCFHLKFKEVAR